MIKQNIVFACAGREYRGRQFHKCTVCGKVAHWDENWSWYGSYRDLDDGVPVRKFCSEECKKGDVP